MRASQNRVVAAADPRWHGYKAGYTLDKSPVHHRADIKRQTTIHTQRTAIKQISPIDVEL